LSIPGRGTVVATIEPSAIDATFALLQARAALASTSELTAIPPATLAKLLVYEARDDDTSLFSVLVVVKRQAGVLARPPDGVEGRSHRDGSALGRACPRHWP